MKLLGENNTNNLTPSLQKEYELTTGQHVRNLSIKELWHIINKLYYAVGQRAPDDEREQALFTGCILNAFRTHGPIMNTTVNELEAAFSDAKYGVFGAFFDTFGVISEMSIIKMVKMFMNEQTRIFNRKLIAQAKQGEQPMTEEQKDVIMQGAYQRVLNEAKTLEVVDDTGNAVYNWLERKKVINFSVDEKTEALKIANEILKREILDNFTGLAMRSKFKEAMKELEGDKSQWAIVLAKKLLLTEYLKTLNQNQ